MFEKISERIFLIVVLCVMLISGNLVLAYPQTTNSNFVLHLKLAPSNVELSNSAHQIGYVWFANNQGNPVTLSKDITIKLQSSSPDVASVEPQVTLGAQSEFAVFQINTHGVKGKSEITASFDAQTATDTIYVGEKEVDIKNELLLEINLPTSEMNVNSQMPFSLYLTNLEGNVIQAPFDIDISLDYENSLVTVDAPDLTINKGDSYVWGTIKTKDKVGNAFLRATVEKLGIDEAKEIKISSSLPASLSVNVFPNKVPATLKRDVDVIVSLVDSDGLPTLAQEDVKLDFFSDVESVNSQIDRMLKESSQTPTIKKGEFSYRLSTKLDLTKENTTITIGASTKGLGIATDTFETVKPITTNNQLAQNKTIQVFVLNKIPTKSQSIAVYQVGTLLKQQTSGTENPGSTDVVFIPLIVNENYDSKGETKKINIITSNNLLAKVLDEGNINAAASYGVATVSTGQETGTVFISSTIKGIGSSTSITEVINTLKQESTIIFSPTGQDAILFDKIGKFDLFVLSLDSKGRPTSVENEIRYLITPINEIVNIEKGSTFTHVNFQGRAIQSNEESVLIKTVPIGESADANLETSHTYVKNPTAKLNLFTIFDVVNTEHQFPAVIQLVDLNDRPIVLSEPLKVSLIKSKEGLVDTPDFVTIPAGTSYIQFQIASEDQTGDVGLTSAAKGIVNADASISIKSFKSKLKISIGSVMEQLQVDLPVQLKIYVDDELQNSVGGAAIKVTSSDVQINSENIKTSQDGSAIVTLSHKKAPKATLQIIAQAEGYSEDQKTIDFDVAASPVEKKTEIPQEIVYGGIAAAIAVVAAIVFVLRKPRIQLEDEDFE